MPTEDHTSDGAGRQAGITENSHADNLEELKRIELQMQLGFITRRGIATVCRVSPSTVMLWERRGLLFFHPGTGESWCTVAAFREFSSSAETFPAVKIKRSKPK